jgi:hypothetical protein
LPKLPPRKSSSSTVLMRGSFDGAGIFGRGVRALRRACDAAKEKAANGPRLFR